MSNEITIYEGINDPMKAVVELGQIFAESGMFGCEKLAQGQVLALACMAERKNPIELARVYHMINGKLSMRADAMYAEFRKIGGRVTWITNDETGAKARFAFEDNDLELSFMFADAKRAGLLPAQKAGSGWAKFPAEMMRARLISKAVRMLAPEVCAGYYTEDETAEFASPNRVVTQSVPNVPLLPLVEMQEEPPVEIDIYKTLAPFLNMDDSSKGYNYDRAMAFLIAHKWLNKGQCYVDLNDTHKKQIADRPQAFIDAANNEYDAAKESKTNDES